MARTLVIAEKPSVGNDLARVLPGPFARADDQGLDEVLAALERAQSEWGENYAPPLVLRRLVA